jgi:hypothetical protein
MFTKRLRITTIVVALLLAGLIGAAVVQPDAEAAGTRRFTVPAAAFIPTNDGWDYNSLGDHLVTPSGVSGFTAPLSFPVDKVRIDRVIMRAKDNGGDKVCVWLYRAQPGTGSKVKMAQRCSKGAATTDPRSFATSAISPASSGPWYGLYLWVNLPAPTHAYKFYGVTIEWTPL